MPKIPVVVFVSAGLLSASACARPAPTPEAGPSPEQRALSLAMAHRPMRAALGGGATPHAHSHGFSSSDATVAVRWPPSARGAMRLARHDRPEGWLEVVAEDLADVPGRIIGNAVAYAEVSPSVDVLQFAERGRVEEYRVHRTAGAPSLARYRLRHGPGIARIEAHEGIVRALGADGTLVFGTERGFVEDARGIRHALDVRVEQIGDATWMIADFERQGLEYPLLVDPAWTTVGSLFEARFQHSATLLPDGRVLVAGGRASGGAILSTAELYDPTSRTWSHAASLSHPRTAHCAFLLPTGKVLVASGLAGDATGFAQITPSASELYDPVADAWTTGATEPTGRWSRACAFPIGGKPLLIGGEEMCSSSPAGCGHATSPFPVPLDVVDGYGAFGWQSVGSLSTGRRYLSATLLVDGRVLVVGGEGLVDDGSGVLQAQLLPPEIYDPASSSSVAATGMAASGTPFLVTTTRDGRALALDGSAVLYDPIAQTSVSSSPSWRHDGGAFTSFSDGRIALVGGYDGDPASVAMVELFEPLTGHWGSFGPSAVVRRDGVSATALSSGGILVVGGHDGSSGPTSGPATDEVDLLTELPTGETCGNDLECLSGLCSGGVCHDPPCTTSADCLTNRYCASSVCVPRLGPGSACTAARDCASGPCVDGVCCDRTCDGKCEACDAAGSRGTCSRIIGAPHGARPACVGSGVGSTCGVQCLGVDATTCGYPSSATVCAVAACKASVETHAATCDGLGGCTDVPKTCGTFACATLACKTVCSTNDDCAPGNYCDGSTCRPLEAGSSACLTASQCASGHCVDGVCCSTSSCAADSSCANPGQPGVCSKKLGTACVGDAECGTGHCADGVCCDTACAGQCEACDALATKGTCAPVAGAPRHGRTPCSDGGGSTCMAAACDGVSGDHCATVVGKETPCRAASCTGSTSTVAAACDGHGACPAAATAPCDPYRCSGDSCGTTCTSDAQCTSSSHCVAPTCVADVALATCTSDHAASIRPDGTRDDCGAYVCADSTHLCLVACGSLADCAVGYQCTSERCEPSGGGSSSGCALDGRSSSEVHGVATAALALLACATRRRRRTRERASASTGGSAPRSST